MAEQLRLDGKVALVTGASAGIGVAAARRLANAGATIVLSARRAERLRILADELNAGGRGQAIVVPADLSSESGRVELMEAATTTGGVVDVLVNNAGYGQPGAVEEVDQVRIRAQLETNFFAAVHLMQLVIPSMRERRSGRIINISGTVGRFAVPGLGFESASKAALESISDAARIEMRPFGVRVIVIQPGMIKTETWDVGADLGDELMLSQSPYSRLYEALMKFAERGKQSGADPDVIARVILHAAAAQRPRTRYAVPLDSRLITTASHLPAPVRDSIMRRAMGI